MAAPRVAAAAPAPVEPSARAVATEPGSTKEKLVAALLELRSAMSAQAVEDSQLIEGQGVVEFIAPRSAKLGLMAKDVDKALATILGRAVRVKITIDEAAVAAAPEKKQHSAEAEDEAVQRAMAHPDVQRFQEMFPGSQVRDIRDLKE